jgi:hypothetical protein
MRNWNVVFANCPREANGAAREIASFFFFPFIIRTGWVDEHPRFLLGTLVDNITT